MSNALRSMRRQMVYAKTRHYHPSRACYARDRYQRMAEKKAESKKVGIVEAVKKVARKLRIMEK